ncbi:SDR family NAD(P)-dependent oxidoreductase [Bacillus sp. ISL-4]|uniref:SDR family NAD(P)-dependent oxidoreductase n=1 Tax=Bacillus sp. ISL-4 TaxID=2819125 RepID=UPI001BE823D8|nr:SDR family NAD(P)-dependent oxidoreductase [Bacillus sp. ISL-4]MBT2668678.1 SDR family NAD(P)-dependent oxidoreductase [Bacillus sp. ISL-4]MBT2669723.1 SDR family NAD(P)-dependent oxidoreductase [Streptomyces sp. ISL-14]
MSNVVVITGAATGLGRATALKLAKEQYKLVIVDFNEIDGQKTADMCVELPFQFLQLM